MIKTINLDEADPTLVGYIHMDDDPELRLTIYTDKEQTIYGKFPDADSYMVFPTAEVLYDAVQLFASKNGITNISYRNAIPVA